MCLPKVPRRKCRRNLASKNLKYMRQQRFPLKQQPMPGWDNNCDYLGLCISTGCGPGLATTKWTMIGSNPGTEIFAILEHCRQCAQLPRRPLQRSGNTSNTESEMRGREGREVPDSCCATTATAARGPTSPRASRRTPPSTTTTAASWTWTWTATSTSSSEAWARATACT